MINSIGKCNIQAGIMMHIFLLLLLCISSLLIESAAATQLPFIFEDDPAKLANCSSEELVKISSTSPELAGIPTLSSYSEGDVVELYTTSGYDKGTKKSMKVCEIKDIFDSRVEPDNPSVRNKGLILASSTPGNRSIAQVCSIYRYLKYGNDGMNGWRYVDDPRGVDYYSYANESLMVGEKAHCAGAGDCDDFALLMSALVESIGGTTRVIMAYKNTTGHAYTEVYLGKLQSGDGPVETTINWLKQTYSADKIYTHIDPETKDVWLNLDWGEDERSEAHPGGELYKGKRHIIITIRDYYEKTPLNPPEGFSPSKPEIWQGQSNLIEEGPASGSREGYQEEEKSPAYSGGGSVDDLIDLGIAQNNEGNYQGAIAFYDRALDKDSRSYLAWELKGIALNGMGKYDEALSCFDKAIEIDPGRDYAWADKGDTLYIMGRYQEAVNCYDRAIAIRPCGNYWKQKGDALRGINRDAEASDALARAQASPKCMD